MSAVRHTLHPHRPLSPLAFAHRHVKAVARVNFSLMVLAIVATIVVGVLAILLLFQATAAH